MISYILQTNSMFTATNDGSINHEKCEESCEKSNDY